jgi:sugar phosphate isomerase/epimerase
MKIGAKFYHYVEGIESIFDKIDFVEVMAIDNKDYGPFLNSGLPIVIHSQHQIFGVNHADLAKAKRNIDSLNYSIKLANYFGSDTIVVHPGDLKAIDGSLEVSVKTLSEAYDPRLVVENLPYSSQLCNSPQSLEEYLAKINVGFCFDVNHAIHFAESNNLDYLNLTKEFLKFKPRHYHIGGQKLGKNKSHLAFEDSDIDLVGILSLYSKDARITLETSNDLEKTKKDVDVIRDVIRRL